LAIFARFKRSILMKSICVFCGSSVGRRAGYIAGAQSLGRLIAGRGLTLVYGGGNIGLMREVADSAIASGGEVIGVMPRSIVEKEIAHQNLTQLHVVGSMHERKAIMADISDAFIALPGGFGTIDELFEIMTWNQLEIINKPTGLLNIDGFFDHLTNYISHAVKERFIRKEHQENLIVETDEKMLLERLEQYRPLKAEKWIDRLKLDLI
jgi:uncharacterized protein (TIGR00730 family)